MNEGNKQGNKARTVVSTLTERAGVTAVQDAIGKMGWFFREQSVADYGIDAQVEIVGDRPSGRLIALQIKSGASYFQRKHGSAYRFSGKNEHLDYWLHHSLPVFLVIHNPENETLLWQRVERHLVKKSSRSWYIDIPEENVLDENAASLIASGVSTDANSQLRFAFSAGLDLMRRIEKGGDVYLSIVIWINKTLGFRGAKIYFDDYKKSAPDLYVNTYAPTHDVPEICKRLFPWAEFEYVEPVTESSGEVESHVLRIELNSFGKSFLALERFYSGELPPPQFPDPIQDEDAERTASDFYWGEEDEL